MAKSQTAVKPKKQYPDVSGIFAAKEKARLERANATMAHKLTAAAKIREMTRTLRSAKTVRKGKVRG